MRRNGTRDAEQVANLDATNLDRLGTETRAVRAGLGEDRAYGP